MIPMGNKARAIIRKAARDANTPLVRRLLNAIAPKDEPERLTVREALSTLETEDEWYHWLWGDDTPLDDEVDLAKGWTG